MLLLLVSGKRQNKKQIFYTLRLVQLGEQINFEVKQHKFYVLKNQNDKGYMNQVSWSAPKEEAKMFASEEDAKREAINLATAMAKVGVELSFKVEEI